MKNLSKTDKLIISILVVWTFLHSYLYLIREAVGATIDGYWASEVFYPMENNRGYISVKYYDLSEWFVYVIGAWVIFAIYKFITSNKSNGNKSNNIKSEKPKDRIELLKDLAFLKESGMLTEEEIQIEKNRILNKESDNS